MGNQITLIVQKIVILALYGYAYYRFKLAKRIDGTLKLRTAGVVRIELIAVLVLNALFIVLPSTEETITYFVMFGVLLIMITFFHLRRIVACGKKVLYALEHPFDIRKIERKMYQNGKFTFVIQATPVSVRYPLADMDFVMTSLSGKRPRKGA